METKQHPTKKKPPKKPMLSMKKSESKSENNLRQMKTET